MITSSTTSRRVAESRCGEGTTHAASIKATAPFSEELRICATPKGYDAVLLRFVEGRTLSFPFTEGTKQTVRPSEGMTEGVRAALDYNIGLFNRWFGLALDASKVGEFTNYIFGKEPKPADKSDDDRLMASVIKDTEGKVMFSGFSFKAMPGRPYYRKGT